MATPMKKDFGSPRVEPALAAVKLNSYIAILASPKHKNACCSIGIIGKKF